MNRLNEKIAVALGFEPDKNSAPVIIAQGSSNFAEILITKACELKIPVVQDPMLSSVLVNLSCGQEIPEQLYKAISVIFAVVFQNKNPHSNES